MRNLFLRSALKTEILNKKYFKFNMIHTYQRLNEVVRGAIIYCKISRMFGILGARTHL